MMRMGTDCNAPLGIDHAVKVKRKSLILLI